MPILLNTLLKYTSDHKSINFNKLCNYFGKLGYSTARSIFIITRRYNRVNQTLKKRYYSDSSINLEYLEYYLKMVNDLCNSIMINPIRADEQNKYNIIINNYNLIISKMKTKCDKEEQIILNQINYLSFHTPIKKRFALIKSSLLSTIKLDDYIFAHYPNSGSVQDHLDEWLNDNTKKLNDLLEHAKWDALSRHEM